MAPPSPAHRVKRVAVRSMGCQLNTHEGEILKQMVGDPFKVVGWNQKADYYVLNTCSVTAKADARARNSIRNAHRRNPEAKIVVTGCYAQTHPDVLSAMPEVHAVVGNHEKVDLPTLLDLIESGDPIERVQVSNIWKERTLEVPLISDYPGMSRPFVKIQDGCNEVCSFCKIPQARGRNRSSPADRIVDQVTGLVEKGYREVVFAGVHMGCWGEDFTPPSTLASLLCRVLAISPDLRVRLSSIEPNHVTDELIDLVASEQRICRNLHLPLQNGDDEILARMRRRYTSAQYAQKVRRCVERIPDLCVGADVIVGFPGETEEHFRNTCAFIQSIPLAYLHVFPYSPRDRTAAASMPDPVDPDSKSLRGKILRELSIKSWRAFVTGQVGRTHEAIVIHPGEGDSEHSQIPEGHSRCYTSHAIDVVVPVANLARGQVAQVKVTGLTPGGEFATGELVRAPVTQLAEARRSLPVVALQA